MSLFFEDEILKMKDKANSSELLEILTQDPRGRGKVLRESKSASSNRTNTRQDKSRNRRW